MIDTIEKWTPERILKELSVPVTQRGMPNMKDYPASRFVTKSEAEAHEWSWYRDGSSCRCGHTGCFQVSNPSICSECLRVRDGKPLVYGLAKHQEFTKAGSGRKPKAPTATLSDGTPVIFAAAPSAANAPEPDVKDRKFLESLAEVRDFTAAAKAAGTTVALIQSRISCNKIFGAAVNDLTERLGIAHPVAVSGERKLTPDERKTFCRAWVDTGSLSRARASIGISASQMHDELERVPEFKDMFEDAAPKAARSLDDMAVDLSLAGNDKLLGRTLPAKLPAEYTEKMRLDVTTPSSRMTDTQLDQKIIQMMQRLERMAPHLLKRPDVVDGEILDAEVLAPPEPEAQPEILETNTDLR